MECTSPRRTQRSGTHGHTPTPTRGIHPPAWGPSLGARRTVCRVSAPPRARGRRCDSGSGVAGTGAPGWREGAGSRPRCPRPQPTGASAALCPGGPPRAKGADSSKQTPLGAGPACAAGSPRPPQPLQPPPREQGGWRVEEVQGRAQSPREGCAGAPPPACARLPGGPAHRPGSESCRTSDAWVCPANEHPGFSSGGFVPACPCRVFPKHATLFLQEEINHFSLLIHQFTELNCMGTVTGKPGASGFENKPLGPQEALSRRDPHPRTWDVGPWSAPAPPGGSIPRALSRRRGSCRGRTACDPGVTGEGTGEAETPHRHPGVPLVLVRGGDGL